MLLGSYSEKCAGNDVRKLFRRIVLKMMLKLFQKSGVRICWEVIPEKCSVMIPEVILENVPGNYARNQKVLRGIIYGSQK